MCSWETASPCWQRSTDNKEMSFILWKQISSLHCTPAEVQWFLGAEATTVHVCMCMYKYISVVCAHVYPRGDEKGIMGDLLHHSPSYALETESLTELGTTASNPLSTPHMAGVPAAKPSFATQGECRGFELRSSGLLHKHSLSLSHLPSPSDPAHSRFSGKGRWSGGSGCSFGLWGSSNQLPPHSNFQQRETESQRANVHVKANEKLSICL